MIDGGGSVGGEVMISYGKTILSKCLGMYDFTMTSLHQK